MSLFMCDHCGNIENSNRVNDDIVKSDYEVSFRDNLYPNMSRTEMEGHGKRLIYTGRIIKDNGAKFADEVLMLCNECNTGNKDREYRKATKDELKVAKLSKYNYITPFDHRDRDVEFIKDDNEPSGYKYEFKFNRSKRPMLNLMGAAAMVSGTNMEKLIDATVGKPTKGKSSKSVLIDADIARIQAAAKKRVDKAKKRATNIEKSKKGKR